MYHAIATRTVLPSLKSAREYCGAPRPPQIVASSADPQDCWLFLLSISSGREINKLEEGVLNGRMVFQTADWTYYIIEDKAGSRK